MNKKTFLKSEFARNAATLMTGTTISQAIPLAVTPILTRLYTPQDFGVLALFLSITAIMGIVATGRYELAVMLPKEDSQARNLVFLSSILTLGFSIILFVFILIFNTHITQWLDEPSISLWLYFVPLSVLLTGFYNGLKTYNNRIKNYKGISASLITKSTSQSIVTVGLGFLKAGVAGLVIGQIISLFTGNFVLFKKMISSQSIKKSYDTAMIKSLARKYSRFPKLTLPGNLMNSLSLNAVNFFISGIFSTFILGHFSLAMRVIGIPSRFIGNSVGQVYFQKLAQVKSDGQHVLTVFNKTAVRLLLFSIPIFLILFFIIEPVFGFVFGEEWRIAGTYATVLVPLAATRFVSSALSPTLHVYERQDLTLIIQAIQLITLILIFVIVNYLTIDFYNTLIIYSFVYAIEYAFFVLIYRNVVLKK